LSGLVLMADDLEDGYEAAPESLFQGPVSPQFLAGLIVGIRDHLKFQDRVMRRFHGENKTVLDAMERKLDIAAIDHEWIENTGRPMDDRLKVLESAALVTKGKVAALAAVCTACGGLIVALGKSGVTWLMSHAP